MKRARVFAAVAIAVVASAFACVDLFHSTDVPTLCDTDANLSGCTTDAAPEADVVVPIDICAGDAGAAQKLAAHACAYLAACEHPLGDNVTGACMVDAILAYDCVANPNRKVKGKTLAFWQCMQNANTCDAVSHCVFPDGVPQGCNFGGFIGCSGSTFDLDTRVECFAKSDAAPSGGENCTSHGQTCDALDPNDPEGGNYSALCVGPQRRACIGSSGCVAGGVSFCNDAGLDLGYSCTDFGAGTCNATGASATCEPENASTSGCSGATNDITCTPGNITALGCVTGKQETVDCTAISGPGTCVANDAGGPGTIPASACYVSGGCTDDACDGGALAACVRGRTVNIDCVGVGLHACNNITTVEGVRAACTP